MQYFMRKIDPDINMDRFYSINTTRGLFGEFGVQRLWGRRGTNGQTRFDWYGCETDATAAAKNLATAKLSNVYVLRL